MSKVAMEAKKDIMHGNSSMDSWLLPLLSAQSATIRDRHWAPNMAPFPAYSASYLVADRLHWIASIMERVAFVLTGIDSYTGYGFSFPECKCFCQTTIHGLTECLTHSHGISHNIAFDQGTPQWKEAQQWVHTYRIFPGLIIFPTNLKQLFW